MTPQLGELYAATGRMPAAISMFISAGKGKEAAELVRGLSPASVASALSTGGAPWQRAAAYRVIAALEANAPTELVELFGEQLAADSDLSRTDLPESVRISAAHALATVALQMPAELKPVTFERLEEAVVYLRALDMAKASADALIRLTQVHAYDAAERLIELFLEDRPLPDIDASWVGQAVAADSALKDQVLAAARQGDEQALEALVWAEHEIGEDAELRAAATDQVTRFANATTREERPDGTFALYMGIRFELGGLLARFAEDEARAGLAAHLREIALDDADAESSRSSAVNGQFNMAAELDGPARAELAAVIRPLAFGEYQRNDVERSEVDPLSRFQMRHDVVDSLHASALGLAARLSALGTEVGYLQDAVNEGLSHATPRVRAAALDALARDPSLTAPDDLVLWLGHSEDEVVRQAVKALAAHQPEWLAENLSALTKHPSFNVRMLALTIAAGNGHAEALTAMAEEDPNAYLRELAASELRGLGAG